MTGIYREDDIHNEVVLAVREALDDVNPDAWLVAENASLPERSRWLRLAWNDELHGFHATSLGMVAKKSRYRTWFLWRANSNTQFQWQ